MTTVRIATDHIEISGHATDPVVCHAISGMSQMVSNYVYTNNWGTVEINDKEAYMKICLKAEYREEHLIRALEEALTDICHENPQSVEVWVG